MSTFLELYGDLLDEELGTADRTQLFLTTRRKAAINAGQMEFVRRTECLQRQVSVSIVSDTQEYDLEAAISDFGWIAKQGVSIQIVEGSNTRYIEGDDLTETTVGRLNTEEPGWRAATGGTPAKRYLRPDGGAAYLGFHPAPSFSSGTWTALVPCVIVPTDMSADADVPFTYSSNPMQRLRFYHQALVHWAAYVLEKRRKDTERSATQFQLFEAEVEKYIGAMKPKGGQPVRMAVNYRGVLRGIGRALDPRRYP